jgi:hypothetical protein
MNLKTYTIWYHEVQMFTTHDEPLADAYYEDLRAYLVRVGKAEDAITMSQLQGEIV